MLAHDELTLEFLKKLIIDALMLEDVTPTTSRPTRRCSTRASGWTPSTRWI